MIYGVVLDMDGTLCDTEVVWRDVAFLVAAELGVDLPVETYLAIVGLPDLHAVAGFVGASR